jgi:hypothetical protein
VRVFGGDRLVHELRQGEDRDERIVEPAAAGV